MITPLFQGLAGAINTALRTDPATLAKLSQLQGLTYAIHSTLPPVELTFKLGADGIEILETNKPAQVTLRGTALALVRLLVAAKNDSGALSQSNVEISGDAAALLQLSRAFADLEIDWEELLSRLIGDVAARGVTQTLRQTRDFESRYRQQNIDHLKNFAHGKLGLTPSADVRALSQRSRELQYRIDRLESRVKLKEATGKPHAK
jgi:ubiquinone biosynthesis accessory factor UbiJ